MSNFESVCSSEFATFDDFAEELQRIISSEHDPRDLDTYELFRCVRRTQTAQKASYRFHCSWQIPPVRNAVCGFERIRVFGDSDYAGGRYDVKVKISSSFLSSIYTASPLSGLERWKASLQFAGIVPRTGEFGTFADFRAEAMRIIDAAAERGIILRLLGGAAIRFHSPGSEHMYELLKRAPKHDMDFVSYSKYRPLTRQLMKDMGYTPYITLAMTSGAGRHRQIFNDAEGNKAIDVFLDKLPMCHVIHFEDRLEIDYPTIPVAELFLQKAQIYEMNEKDWQDMCILLRAHAVTESDKDAINLRHVAKLLANDWGFYYTVSSNLKGLRAYAAECPGLSSDDRVTIGSKLDLISDAIRKEPKTLKWKMRARVGTSKKWYNVVEEVQRDTISG